MRLRSQGKLPTSNQMERNGSGVLFMDVFSDPMCFGALYEHIHRNDKATLRLVCKELRDAVNLNARGLQRYLDDDDEPVDMSHFISKLPNLESIAAHISFSSIELVSVFQGAQLASKLTELELRNTDDEEEDEERGAEVLENSFGTINHHCWPVIRLVHLCELDTTVSLDAMKGLLRLSTLTKLELQYCRFNSESINLIRPSSWPCLRHLELEKLDLEDPNVAIRALLHLTGLEELSLEDGGITGEALAQIQPGSWPNLQVLDLGDNEGHEETLAAMKGLLHLTALTKLVSTYCRLTEEAISQIKPGDWPHLQKLEMSNSDLSGDPVGVMKGLLCLTSLQRLDLFFCRLTGEAISQIKPGDWPHLQILRIGNNYLSDDPVGAMKGLLHLTALTELDSMSCELTGEAVSQIKHGDLPQLQKLGMSVNDFSDDLVGAMKGLLHLTALTELDLYNCSLTGEALSQIRPGDLPHLQILSIDGNDLSDDKEGAKKGMVHLTSLDNLDIRGCGWSREEDNELCRALGVKARYIDTWFRLVYD